MGRMDATSHRRWRVCLALAVCCAVYAVTVAAAFAYTVPDSDMAIARAQLPADHPCRAHIDIVWIPGLLDAEGKPADALAQLGHRDSTGQWVPMACAIALEPARWGRFSPCTRRRMVMHEAMHLEGAVHAPQGLMATYWEDREVVQVPGCPPKRVSLRDRATERLLQVVPVGFSVSCGDRRGLVVRCRADVDGRRVRRYSARLLDAAGARFVLRRDKREVSR